MQNSVILRKGRVGIAHFLNGDKLQLTGSIKDMVEDVFRMSRKKELDFIEVPTEVGEVALCYFFGVEATPSYKVGTWKWVRTIATLLTKDPTTGLFVEQKRFYSPMFQAKCNSDGKTQYED